MIFLVYLGLSTQLGLAAATTWVPSHRRQLPADENTDRADTRITSTILRPKEEINRLGAALASLIDSIFAPASSSTAGTTSSASAAAPSSLTATTSIRVSTTTTAIDPQSFPVSTASTRATSTNSFAASSSASTAPASASGISAAMGALPSVPVPSVPSAPDNTTMALDCASLCSNLTFPAGLDVHPISCVPYAANSTITIEGGQRTATCGTTVTPSVDICRVALTVSTSRESETYMEVWLPDGETEWNGRTMSTDNGGVNGCVKFVDMNYATSLGFAAIGDNAGHNGSSFDGSWFAGSNELIIDWVYRARHSSVVAGKAVVEKFYTTPAEYSYYIGCSAGGAQGLKSAQVYPEDFDGIISGSAAADFNHLQAWSGRFVQLTGLNSTDPKFLTQADWITVQAAILSQCDEPIDGVADGILEDPTQCDFDSTVLACSNNSTLSGCLTDTQVTTVNEVFTALYNTAGELLFPALLYGSQVDAFRLGQLSGSIQGISSDWYKLAVLKDPSWNPLDMDQADYALADSQNLEHGGVSGWSGDLSRFQSAGGKLLMFHGMADPLVTAANSQRYYLKVAKTMGLDSPQMDDFMRLFRISGMAHCGVGGISGAGAWMFGQNSAASAASTNIITELQNWVENDSPPDTLTGTKFWWDTPSLGVQFERRHCRFPYRTTFNGGGADPNALDSWSCVKIEEWRECEVGASPRLCNADGSFK